MQDNACCTLPELDDLQNQLDETERELASQTRQRDSLKEDIVSVQKTNTELDQSGDAYGKALDALKNSKKELNEYYLLKWRMVECAVDKNKDEIEAAIKKYDDDTELKRYRVEELVDQHQEATIAYDEATSALNDRKQQFDEYKDYKAKVEKKLKEIQTLKGKIEREDDASHPASMYFLLSEMKKSLEDVKLPSAEELQKKARDRWCDLYEANKDARDKKAALDEKKTALQKEQAALEERQQKRTDNILLLVAKYNQSSGACPPLATSKKATSPRA